MSFLSQGELPHVISTYGYGAVAGLVGLESMGIPVPGETTLIAAALIAATTHALYIWLVIAAAAGGAILGDNLGFFIGRALGFRLLVRYGPRIGLGESRIRLGQYLFLRHGAKVVFFGRFVSVLRALAALLAGMNRMGWSRFLIANAAGAVAWSVLYGVAAYYLGKEAQHLAAPVGIVIGIAAALLVIVGIIYLRRNEKRLEAEAERTLPGPLEKTHPAAKDR